MFVCVCGLIKSVTMWGVRVIAKEPWYSTQLALSGGVMNCDMVWQVLLY